MFTTDAKTQPRIDRSADRTNDTSVDPHLVRAPEPAVEAPDRGDDRVEPLEDAVIRHAEAPDAGDCRADLAEQDYTHGRSMT
ncbi:hypothetical protein AB1L88_18145 [Tautonia sp. JC769]|uniref:hypothetical protein n=1 Tax=Tautonia sp. JC769 TaxID=3232135 RepID=UPI003458310F